MEKKGYSVSEAVRLVGVESHVLRYWEEELQVEIRRTSQGHRIYSQENIETFCMVRELKEYGLQLKAIRFLLDKTVENRKKAELTEQIFEIGGGRESFSREGEPVQGKTKRTAKTREARETFWDNTEETAEELEMEEEEEAFWDNTEEAEETETGGKEAPFWGDAEEAETGGKKSPFWDDAEEELKTEEEEAPFWDDAEETEDEAAEKWEREFRL